MNTMNAEFYVKEYGKSLYSFCLYCTRDKEAADDLYQQTFLVALEKDEIKREANPKSYLITIAMNLWRNQMRKAAWRKKIADVSYLGEEELAQIADRGCSVEEEVQKRQEEMIVRKNVLKLPDKLRIVILLYYMEDMSVEEIALALKIPAGTVKSRMNKAKNVLKERLQYGK
ncbi:MAG: RNA polymerase sigma factor [Lachnospiraceae bacterium]|nr:RNA polymerase sigma factor [Lachnospiraceae bacterium]MBR4608352.1 RNA polymerase sigma factor [Lachnospiraceae bacterium]